MMESEVHPRLIESDELEDLRCMYEDFLELSTRYDDLKSERDEVMTNISTNFLSLQDLTSQVGIDRYIPPPSPELTPCAHPEPPLPLYSTVEQPPIGSPPRARRDPSYSQGGGRIGGYYWPLRWGSFFALRWQNRHFVHTGGGSIVGSD